MVLGAVVVLVLLDLARRARAEHRRRPRAADRRGGHPGGDRAPRPGHRPDQPSPVTELDRLLDFAARSRLPERRLRLPRVRRAGGARPAGRDLDRRPDDARLRPGAPAGPAGGGGPGPARRRGAHRRPAARRRARRLAVEHRRRHEGRLRARLRRPRRVRRPPPPASTAAGRCWTRRWPSGRPGSGTTTPGWRSRSGTAPGRGAPTTAASTPTCTASRPRWPRPTRCDDPATADRLRDQALRSTERVVHGWARERDWRLPEHFTHDWTPLPDYNRDAPGGSVPPLRRHGRAPVRVGPAGPAPPRRSRPMPPAWLLDDALALFDAAATRGWAADGRDGFPYTLGWDDRPVVGARMHWVLCEAVASATVLAEVTGEQRYRDLAARWREHGETRFADPATGQLAPRAHAGRRRRHRHLVGPARRVPPGPDAAPRRPPRPRQRRRRAALTGPAQPAVPVAVRSGSTTPKDSSSWTSTCAVVQRHLDLVEALLVPDLGAGHRGRRPGAWTPASSASPLTAESGPRGRRPSCPRRGHVGTSGAAAATAVPRGSSAALHGRLRTVSVVRRRGRPRS